MHKSSAENTKENNSDHIRRLERYLAVEGGYDYEGCWTDIEPDDVRSEDMVRPRDLDEKIAYRFLDDYLSEDYSGGTQTNTADNLSAAYEWCVNNTKPVTADPIGHVLENHPNLLDESTERDPYIIDIEEARRVINNWDNPRYLAVNLVLAKTLRRIGGVVNLDIRNVNIDHPACDWSVHKDLRRWPDHMVFPKDKEKSESGRKDGNKTKTTRKVPIDDELKDTLLLYLAARRGSMDPSDPLFRGMQSNRWSAAVAGDKLREQAKKMGHWYGPDDDDNLNPHYWRHWTTTWFEDQLGENNSLVTYFRGDKGQTAKSGYNHWTEEKERLYREHVPKFFTGEVANEP